MKHAACLLLICGLAMAQTNNPVTNGGFETLDAKGFPVDWEPVGLEVKLTPEAHSGKNAILLHRPANADERRHETGLNRVWKMDSGERGKMLTVAKGGLRFWYKVKQADPDVVMKMNVIAMDKRPFEGCGVPRPFYQVPRKHFGDGQWHEGVLAFDFSENTRFEWLQVSPRITGPGDTEWLIDDLRWVESVGPLPHTISLKSYKRLDGSLQLRCLMTNSGDVPLTAGSVTLSLPEPLRLDGTPAKQDVRKLAPDMFEVASWNIKGQPRPGSVPTARFTASGKTVEVTCSFGPALDWIQFQTERNVLWPGQEMDVDLVAYNRGDAILPRIDLDILLPGELELLGTLPRTLENVPPWGKGRVQFRVRAKAKKAAAALHCQWLIPGGRSGDFTAEVAIGRNPAGLENGWLTVACDSFEIVFPKNDFGLGQGWVYAKHPNRRLVGAVPNLGRLVTTNTNSTGVVLVAGSARTLRDGKAIGANSGSGLRFTIEPAILARAAFAGPMYVDFLAAKAGSGKANELITCRITAPAPKEGTLLALDGPQLTTLVGGKDEALAPGMEWLLGDEDSSNDNVIGYNQTHRLRWRPHPHLVTVPMLSVRRKDVLTAVFWHPRAKWNDGTRRSDLKPGEADTDRPTPVFATPDRFGGHACATMGLSVPSVGTYGERNKLGTGKGWPAAGVNATKIDFSYAFYVQTGSDSALDALKAWFAIYGVAPPAKPPQAKKEPPLASPTTRFRGLGVPDWVQSAHANSGGQGWPSKKQWIDELEWSMQAYLDTLWDPETKEWRVFHGGPPVKHRNGAYPNYLFDCVTVAKLTDDRDLKRRLEARAKEVTDAHGGPAPSATDYGLLYGNPLAHIANQANQAAALLKSQDANGGWRYRTRVEQGGVFKGRDYAGLSPDGFEANGLVARKAWTLLRAHSMTGDKRLLDGGLKALAYMDRFRVPRAAQVWEVIGHAPDILAAADACQAYVEGYRATGDRKYLKKAEYWAWAGLPFVYQWGVDDYPWLRYGSIPIFGSTWWTCTWFGRPVQWNGLRYAYAVMELDECVPNRFRWQTIATGLTVSALNQQGMDPKNKENYALWPDVYNAVTGQRVEWNFAPRGIIINIHKLMGREPYPVVQALPTAKGKPPIRVIGCARFVPDHDRYWGKQRTVDILFDGGYPLGGRIVFAGVTEPQKVGNLRRVVGNPPEPGTWSYDPETRSVVAFPRPDYKIELGVIGVDPVEPGFTPGEKTNVNFEFDATLDGWRRMHDIVKLDVRGGICHVETDGGDPYMVRSFCRIDGDSVSRIRVRLAADAGNGAQFFWTTEDEPNMAEDKRIDIAVTADGEFHEIVFPVGDHPKWRGKTITSIRLDPIAGTEKAKVTIDWIRGEK